MKKLAIMAVLASAFTMASAAELGVNVGRNFGSDQSYVGVSLGQKQGIYGVALGFDHASSNVSPTVRSWNRLSLTGSRDLLKVGQHTVFGVKLGAAFVDPSKGKSGAAVVVGLGTTHPVTKHTSFVTDLSYQHGQNKIHQYDGGQFSLGFKHAF